MRVMVIIVIRQVSELLSDINVTDRKLISCRTSTIIREGKKPNICAEGDLDTVVLQIGIVLTLIGLQFSLVDLR